MDTEFNVEKLPEKGKTTDKDKVILPQTRSTELLQMRFSCLQIIKKVREREKSELVCLNKRDSPLQ